MAWEDTYGGKLCENIVQAAARDIMMHGGINAHAVGFPLIMSVHDEWVAEVPDDLANTDQLDYFNDLLCELPPWCADWPIVAEGFISKRYRK